MSVDSAPSNQNKPLPDNNLYGSVFEGQSPNNVNSQPHLSKNSMKRLVKLILRTYSKMSKQKKIGPKRKIKVGKPSADSEHQNLHEEITAIKNKLKQRADINKLIQEQKKKEFFDKKQAEKIVDEYLEKEEENKKSPEPQKEIEKTDTISDDLVIEKKKIELVDKKKKELEEIKIVLKSLEEKHNELVKKKHDPVILVRLDEKINLLKRRINHIENE
ncbi:hypothetical protein C0585_06565 [Candidatus Woesearchaeota archaeon]|nr:MAG: hypothetical protein C0585_06565 [Candidatus Woesearchaeota archaeon]